MLFHLRGSRPYPSSTTSPEREEGRNKKEEGGNGITNHPTDRRTDGRLATHLQEEEGEALRISTLSTLAFPSSPLTDIAPLAFPPSDYIVVAENVTRKGLLV